MNLFLFYFGLVLRCFKKALFISGRNESCSILCRKKWSRFTALYFLDTFDIGCQEPTGQEATSTLGIIEEEPQSYDLQQSHRYVLVRIWLPTCLAQKRYSPY